MHQGQYQDINYSTYLYLYKVLYWMDFSSSIRFVLNILL